MLKDYKECKGCVSLVKKDKQGALRDWCSRQCYSETQTKENLTLTPFLKGRN